MRISSNIIPTILLLIIFSNTFSQVIDPEKIRDSCMQSVVSIIVNDGIGSGFVVSSEGHIITNYHVAEELIEKSFYYSPEVRINFKNGLNYTNVKVVNYDQESDLALLKINSKAIKPLPIIPSGDASAATPLVVIGSPLGREFSINIGSISNENPFSELPYISQIDVSINPGNSGGPILNKNGQVIGVVVAKISKEGVEGMGFAIKASKLREFLISSNVSFETLPIFDDLSLMPRELSDLEKKEIAEKEASRIKLEKEKDIQEKLGEMQIDKLNKEQQIELLKIRNEYNKKLEINNRELELQRNKEKKEREWLQLERDKLNHEKEKLAQFKKRKEYFKSLPYRFIMFTDISTKSLMGNLISIDKSFPEKRFNPCINQIFGYRFDIEDKGKRKVGNTVGVGLQYGLLSNLYINNYFSKQNDTFLINVNHTSFYDLSFFIIYKEWVGIHVGKGQINTTSNFNTKLINQYWHTGFQFIIPLWKSSLVFTEYTHFCKGVDLPIVSLSLGIRFNWGFGKF